MEAQGDTIWVAVLACWLVSTFAVYALLRRRRVIGSGHWWDSGEAKFGVALEAGIISTVAWTVPYLALTGLVAGLGALF